MRIGQDLDYASSSKWGGELRGTEVIAALGAGQPQWYEAATSEAYGSNPVVCSKLLS